MPEQSIPFNVEYYRGQQLLKLATSREGQWSIHLGELLAGMEVDLTDCRQALDSAAESTAHKRHDAFSDWARSTLPEDMTGQTVIDVGGFDGFMAQECLERHADKAFCIDNQQYNGYTLDDYPYGWSRPRALEGVKYVVGDLFDVTSWPLGSWPADFVICFNVIYHVRDPLGLIERLRFVTKDNLLLCTSYREGDDESWRFNPDQSRTIYMTPTVPGLIKSLEHYGFKIEQEWRKDNLVILRAGVNGD